MNAPHGDVVGHTRDAEHVISTDMLLRNTFAARPAYGPSRNVAAAVSLPSCARNSAGPGPCFGAYHALPRRRTGPHCLCWCCRRWPRCRWLWARRRLRRGSRRSHHSCRRCRFRRCLLGCCSTPGLLPVAKVAAAYISALIHKKAAEQPVRLCCNGWHNTACASARHCACEDGLAMRPPPQHSAVVVPSRLGCCCGSARRLTPSLCLHFC